MDRVTAVLDSSAVWMAIVASRQQCVVQTVAVAILTQNVVAPPAAVLAPTVVVIYAVVVNVVLLALAAHLDTSAVEMNSK